MASPLLLASPLLVSLIRTLVTGVRPTPASRNPAWSGSPLSPSRAAPGPTPSPRPTPLAQRGDRGLGSRRTCLLICPTSLRVPLQVPHPLEVSEEQRISVRWLLEQMTTSQVANTQSFTLSLFWSPEVQDQGVCRAALLLEVPGEGPPLSLPALVGPEVSWLVAASLQTQPRLPISPLPCVCF